MSEQQPVNFSSTKVSGVSSDRSEELPPSLDECEEFTYYLHTGRSG